MTQALVLIDFQRGFDHPFWGARNNPHAEERAAQLLAHWRTQNLPLHHIRHLSTTPDSPLHPETGDVRFKPEVAPQPDEPVHDKSVNAAFIGTTLEADLRAQGCSAMVICGLTTPHCVSTSTRMAANLGFDVTLAHDACAAVARGADTSWRGGAPVDPEAIHQAALDHLNGEFAKIKTTLEIITP